MSYASRAAILVVALVGCGGGDDAPADPDGALEVDAAPADAGEPDAQLVDALELDAPITGPATPFEVGYASAWTFRGVTGAMSQGIAVVINPETNAEVLELGGLQIISVVDDHAAAVFQVAVTAAATAAVPTGNSAGDMSPAVESQVTPMVREPRTDTARPQLTMSFGGLAMPVNATVNVTVKVRNGSQEATLPFVITLSTSGIGASVTAASRVASVSLL